jgi:alkylation response protein AidB-like acyl-CoA dehydrogenase
MIVMEELARGLPSVALSMSPHVQCMNLIETEGSPGLRERVVSKAICGEHVLAFAITEASGGSDALGIDTTATFDGDGWILNGEKCWITSAGAANGYIVSAKSATSGRYRDVSLFYVDAKTPGLDDSLRTPLIGMKNSPTGVVRMKNCKVPRDCLIGQENSAYGQMKILLNEGRLDMAALAVGIAQGAMECSVKHTSQSGHFGRSLSTYQGVSFQVAMMYEKIFMARNSLYTVAEMFRRQERATMEVAALKLFATEMCLEVCRAAVQLYGAKGLSQYTDVDRYFRDAQMLTIGEGSSEVCQIVISGKLYHTELDQY